MVEQLIFFLTSLGIIYLAIRRPEAAVIYLLFFGSTYGIMLAKVIPNSGIRTEYISLLILSLLIAFGNKYNKKQVIAFIESPIFLGFLIMILYVGFYEAYIQIEGREHYFKNLFVTFLLGTLGSLVLLKNTNAGNLNIGFLFSMFITLLVWIFFINIQKYDIASDRSILESQDIGTNTIIFGREVGLLFCFSLFHLIYSRKEIITRIIYIVTTFIFAYYIFITGTRGVFISIILVFVIVFIRNFKNINFFKVVIIITIALIIINFIDFTQYSLFERLAQSSNGFRYEERYYLYTKALDVFSENPFSALGPAGFFNRFGTYPHNLILEFLVDYGWVSILLIPLLIFYSLSKAIKLLLIRELNPTINIIPLLWLYSFLTTMTSGDILINKFFFIMSLCLIPLNYKYKFNH